MPKQLQRGKLRDTVKSMSLVSKMAASLGLILPSMKFLNSYRCAKVISCSCSLNNFLRSGIMGQVFAPMSGGRGLD